MNLKLLPREIEKLILDHILPIEYQKRHKKKMELVLQLIKNINKNYEIIGTTVLLIKFGSLWRMNTYFCKFCGNYTWYGRHNIKTHYTCQCKFLY